MYPYRKLMEASMARQNNNRKRVALYARVSTGEGMQADGFSIDAQLSEMREYAKTRNWKVVEEFVDAGISGTTPDRPQLNAMKEAAAEGLFDILVVHELSRLSRSSVYNTFSIFEYLGQVGVSFFSVKERQFDLTSPQGRFTLGIFAAVNQYYIDSLSMHTRKSKRQRARDGYYNASVPPYGYRHVGDSKTPPEIVPEQAEVVRLIFEKYVTGQFSYQDLADFLNARDYKTLNGRRFAKDTIADMIRNRFYAGQIVYKQGEHGQEAGEIFEGRHEPIISQDLWEACRKVRSRHQSASRQFQPQVRTYLLGQIVHCHVCGRGLRSQHSGNYSYYRDVSAERGYDDCPNTNTGTRAGELHHQIDAIVREIHLPPDWQEEIAEAIGENKEAATLDKKRAKLIAQRRRLKNLYILGEFEEDADVYQQNRRRIQRELDTLPSKEELIQIQYAAERLEYLHEVWDDAEEEDKHDLLDLMLRRVLVDVDKTRLVLLYPTAPMIPLFRKLPMLSERNIGEFAVAWPPTLEEYVPYSKLEPLIALSDEPASLPFLPLWPWQPKPRSRITPALSDLLKARRQVGVEGGKIVEVPHQGIPSWRVDSRSWPEVELVQAPLSEVLNGPENALAVVNTPLAVQRHPDRNELARRIYDRLTPHGFWYWQDLLPASMPAHWLFGYFRGLWTEVKEIYWDARQIYNEIRGMGYQVEQEEHTFYQPINLRTAAAIVEERHGPLQLLADEVYNEGLQRLMSEIDTRGEDAQVGSEVTLIEVRAYKV
jgi:site-specific DNA recombinase